AEVLPLLEEVAADQPFDEAAQARLIRGYHAVGRRAQALARYREVRARLVDELGVEPGPVLAEAHMALLRSGPDCGTGPTRLTAPTGAAIRVVGAGGTPGPGSGGSVEVAEAPPPAAQGAPAVTPPRGTLRRP